MNSYEPRLSNLKQQTGQLADNDLVGEIEAFAVRWSDTYQLISKWTFFYFVIFADYCFNFLELLII